MITLYKIHTQSIFYTMNTLLYSMLINLNTVAILIYVDILVYVFILFNL